MFNIESLVTVRSDIVTIPGRIKLLIVAVPATFKSCRFKELIDKSLLKLGEPAVTASTPEVGIPK